MNRSSGTKAGNVALLFGRHWTREQLLDRVEDISQLMGARRGKAAEAGESDFVDLWNSSGLRLTLLPGRCLDIAYADYKGFPLCFRGAPGDVGPSFYEPLGFGWMRGFFAGLLTTCGLTFVGDPEVDPLEEEVELGCHGRISFAPAKRLAIDERWEGHDYVLRVAGHMREAISLGTNLHLTRRITMKLGEPRVFINDQIENCSRVHSSPLMVVYHSNVGFPLLNESARLILSSARTIDSKCGAEVDPHAYAIVPAPAHDIHDRLFVHDPAADHDGNVHVAIVSDHPSQRSLGMYWRFKKSELPILNQWQHFVAGAYVMGIEPGNCSVLGRRANRQAGTLQRIAPGDRRDFNLEIGILEGPAEIQAFEKTKSLR